MIPLQSTRGLSVPAIAAWLMLGISFSSKCAAQDPFSGTPPKPTFTQSVKQSFSKMGDALTPSSKPKTATGASDDATLLSSQAKPSAELYLSIAKLHEEANRPAQAEEQYQHARQEFPNHLAAMLSYAHFLENQGRQEEAVNLYRSAIKAHPNEASPYNNLSMCHARKKNIKEATSVLGQAVQRDPKNPLYRNNIAALLVEQNRLPEAFEQLRAVHGDANAYYNLGYLLSKKGDTAAAEHHFKRALMVDPTMEPAARWLSYLQNKSQPTILDGNYKVIRPERHVVGNPPPELMATRIAPPPATTSAPVPQQNPYYSPERQAAPKSVVVPEPQTSSPVSTPKRLPPIVVRQPVDYGVPARESSDSAPAAPLPPGLQMP